MSHNQLQSLQDFTFQMLKMLHVLNIEFNIISIVEKHAFNGLPKLHRLNLRGNRIKEVALGELLTDVFVYLDANPIQSINNLTGLQISTPYLYKVETKIIGPVRKGECMSSFILD